jgi:hypothetical protein
VKSSTTINAECWAHQPRTGGKSAEHNGESFDPAHSQFLEVNLQPLGTAKGSGNTNSEDQMPLLRNTILVLPGLLTEDECELIVLDTGRILRENKARVTLRENWASFSSFTPECQKIVERVLREHVLAFIDLRLPDVANRLFHRNSKPRVNANGQTQGCRAVPTGMPMSFYWDEPVAIKYFAGNRLAPHEDMRELTIVIPLNPVSGLQLQ